MNALDIQIGGDHYKNFKIQPIEFSTVNNLSFLEGCIVKRICRYKSMENPIEDLRKIKHEVDIIMELWEVTPHNKPLIMDTENFLIDLAQLISTQDKWNKEDLLTLLRSLKKNKYS